MQFDNIYMIEVLSGAHVKGKSHNQLMVLSSALLLVIFLSDSVAVMAVKGF